MKNDRPLDPSLYESGRPPAGRTPASPDPAPPRPSAPQGPESPQAPAVPTAPPLEAPAREPAAEGRPFGRYKLGRVLGAGGMGVVHEAWDQALGRRVALKVLATGAARSAQAFERFRQEATITARLRHPNIVVVHEAGLAEGQAYIAMELVEGQTLEEEIGARLGSAVELEGAARESARREALTGLDQAAIRRVCALTRDVARALHCGHTWLPPGELDPAPIVHRDVKPANIMVDRHGVPRLLDYGLAKEVGVTLTVTREAVGTPLYMSPEQLFSARRVGPKSDVYSLGMTLYACLTLARPFELSRPDQLFAHLMHEDPTAPRRLNPAIPRDLETIVLTATAKDERERYASAEDLADDLEAFLSGRPIRARPPSLLRRATRAARRHAALCAAAGLLLVGLVGWQVYERHLEAETARSMAEADIQRAAQVVQARADATVQLVRARVAYELASEAKAQDGEGDRWLTLLNDGHAAERQALDGLARAGATLDEAGQRLLALAQGARGDSGARKAILELQTSLQADLALRPQLDAVLAWLPARIESEPERLLAGLNLLGGDAATERGELGLAGGRTDEVLALFELLGRAKIAVPRPARATDEARSRLIDLRDRLTARRARLHDLARESAPLSQSLAELMRTQAVRVSVPGEPGHATVRKLDESGRPGEVLAEGPTGVELEAGGSVLIEVTQGERLARVPLHLPRAAWGAPRDAIALRLPCALTTVPVGMVLVAGGERPGERPFLLDREEVSRARYQAFLAAVAASGHATCPAEERERFPAGKDHTPAPGPAPERLDLPVTGIDWDDARAFAAWAGGRLPTRAEWRRAVDPLGQGVALDEANLAGIDDGQLWLAPGGVGPEAPCGARALVGNAAEWLASEELALPFREAAGGGYGDEATDAEALVGRYAPGARGADLGFRCARDLPAGPALAATPAEPRETDSLVSLPARLWTLGEAAHGRPGQYAHQPGDERHVRLSAFAIQAEPVTRAHFAAWLAASGTAPDPRQARELELDPQAPVEATWEQAAAYAAWAGMRLPSEAEWQAASEARVRIGAGPDPAGFASGKLAEWVRDAWQADFPALSEGLRDPWNRWTPDQGHVLRRRGKVGARRSCGDGAARAAFRCARTIESSEEAR